MWRAAGSPENKRPAEWARKEGEPFIAFIAGNLNVAHSHIEKLVQPSRGGRDPHTSAHWQVGIAYAQYLSHPPSRPFGRARRARPRLTLAGLALSPRREVRVRYSVAVLVFLGAGCATEVASNDRELVQTTDSQEVSDTNQCEDVGQASDPLPTSALSIAAAFDRWIDNDMNSREEKDENLSCPVACALSYGGLCHVVRQACNGATMMSLGRLAIPCATATALACVGGAGMGVICAKKCHVH